MATRAERGEARQRPRPKTYDRAYFDRWYRDPRHAVVHGDLLDRRVRLAVAAAEYVLERPLVSVLDVGCGEAPWHARLRRLRPGVRYVGVDASEYVVRRFGRARSIRLGRLGELGRLGLAGPFDLVVCSDVLHYVPTDEVRRGLRAIARRLGGLAFLETFTGEDATIGDAVGFQARSAATYRRLFRDAGLVALGLHCYVRRGTARRLMALERGPVRHGPVSGRAPAATARRGRLPRGTSSSRR